MSENETNTAVEEIPNVIKIEDAGPGAKKVTVEVPSEKIASKIAEQFKELRQEALIPGFRKGHVPQKLLEKRFAQDVRDQVRQSLIRDGYVEAIEKNSIQVLGEPDFGKLDEVKLEDGKALEFTFSVEIRPEINLPELSGLKIKKPRVSVTDEHVDQAMKNLREQQGTLVPVDRGVEADDRILCDVIIKVDGAETGRQVDTSLIVRPARIAGLQVDDLATQLAGAKAEEMREVKVKVPDDHGAENLRGKEVTFEVTIKDIKKLEPAEINEDFLTELGFKEEKELREALREQMVERIDWDVKTVMRRQVVDYLLGKVELSIPNKLSEKQTQRIVSRRAVDLMTRGVAPDRVQANMDALSAGAADEAQRELKSLFILQKVADDNGVDVSEEELNTRVAMIAMQRGERPEQLKQTMLKDGNLANLYVQMKEEKAVDTILAKAEVTEVDPAELAAEREAKGEKKADESSAT